MSGSVSALRARIVGLMEGSQGVSPWTINAGLFHTCPSEIELQEASAVERSFTVHIDRRRAMEPINTLSGYGLFERRLRIRVGYYLTEVGADATFEAAGEQSGGSTPDAVEDRCDADGVLIQAVISSLRNWSGLSGVSVIDIEPLEPEGDLPDLLGDRAIAVHTFKIKSRDALPGSYGPSL